MMKHRNVSRVGQSSATRGTTHTFTKHASIVLSATVVALAITGLAQVASAQSTEFNTERFEPLPSQRTNTLNVARSEVVGDGLPSAGLLVHFQDDPLQLIDDQGNQFRLIDDQLKAELSMAYGLWDWADIGVIIPVVLYQTGDAAPEFGFPNDISGFATNDIRIVPKVRLVNPELTGGLGVAVAVPISIPSGDADTFNTSGGVGLTPRLIVDFSLAGFKVAANVAYSLKNKAQALNYTSGDTLDWSLGGEVPLGSEDIIAMATLFGSYGLEDGRDPSNLDEVTDNAKARPMEGLVGMKVELPNDLLATAGAGAGLSGGVGSPDFRLLAGLEWGPTSRDTDQDGIIDKEDQCPEEPEDVDSWQDSDGCPDPDNDNDTILDAQDACPDDPEDVDTFEDDNGCPDPDNDQDGVLDTEDRCPLVAGPKENQGCPWEDSDGDGLLDNVDKCVDQPEDIDQFEDEDGCPDPDNDKDGIPDTADKCPLKPETINGNEDEDGCPDKGKTKVVVTREKIEILEKVFFDTGRATIKKRSYGILDQVASVLKAHPEIKLVRIEGHTDDRGSDRANLKLSQRRADSVRKYLIEAGIEAGRLVAKGIGEAEPIDSNKTRAGREKNRRVEFDIINDGGANVETN